MAAASIAFRAIDQCSIPSDRSFLKSVKVGKYQVQIVSNGTKLLYIYREKTRIMIFKLPDNILCGCIALVDENKTLLCGLEDGNICSINLNNLVSHKRKRRTKICNDEPSTSDDIFAGLLEQDDVLPSRNKKSITPTELIQEINESSFVLKIENLNCLMMIGHCLLVMSHNSDAVVVSAFLQKFRNAVDDKCATSSHTYVYFEKMHAFERILKCHRSSPDGTFAATIGDSIMHKNARHILYYVVSNSIANADVSTQLQHRGIPPWLQEAVIVKDELYNELFGSDCNILNSCIILVGLLDGSVVYFPFKNFYQSLATQTMKPTQTLLYNIRQPLALITVISNNNTQNKLAGDVLVLLGSEGKVLMIGYEEEGGKSKAVFKEYDIQGPMQAVTQISSSVLLCSMGKGLLRIKFEDDDLGHGMFPGRISSLDIGVPQVVALSDVYHDKGRDEFCPGNVFVLTSKGKIGHLEIPDKIQGVEYKNTATYAGKRIQELLRTINQLATEMECLRLDSQLHNEIMLELNKACHVASALREPMAAAEPAHLRCAASIVDNLQDNQEWSVNCSVTNQSSFCMGCHWSLNVMIEGQSDWFCQKQQTSASVSKSIPLNVLRPGEIKTVTIKMKDMLMISLPIHVSISIHFDAANLLARLNKDAPNKTVKSQIDLSNESVIIPLHDTHLDILHVLEPATLLKSMDSLSADGFSPNSHQHRLYMPRTGTISWMMETMQTLVESRPMSKTRQPVNSNAFTVTLHIQTDDLCQVTPLKENVHCNSILRWLLSTTAGSDRLVIPATFTGTTIKTMTPEGCEVVLSVATIGDSTVISIQTRQYMVLCQVVTAVHTRIMNISQADQPISMTLHDIHQKVKKVKELHIDLERFKPASLQAYGPPEVQQIRELMRLFVKARNMVI